MLNSVSSSVKLSSGDFQRLSEFIYKQCGIKLTDTKRVLLESRLQKRLAQLNLTSFQDYYQFVISPAGRTEELVHMIDAVATNKTDFFREPVHFHFMQSDILPAFAQQSASRVFKVWSSACSSGEEPYTIAMVLEEFRQFHRFDYRITATDISTKILEKAIQAIYPERTIMDVSMELRRKYMMRSKDKTNTTVRMAPEIRQKVQFKRLNLMDASLDVDRDFDIVFCRNVLIYFDRKTQEEVVRKLIDHLKPGGYLFIGHSESIYHMQLPVVQIRPTIFQKLD